MRVTSDRQTLILAGEMPDLAPVQGARRVTIVSARVDAVVTQELYAVAPSGTRPARFSTESARPAVPFNAARAYSGAADAYARTRDFTDRTSIIDTYA